MQSLPAPTSFTLLFLFALPLALLAQESPPFSCAQPEAHQLRLQNDERYRRAFEQQETLLYEQALAGKAQPVTGNQQPSSGNYQRLTAHTLPLAFHIIHDNGPENISDADVLAALENLNQAFANDGYYNSATGVDTEIAFCLAQRTPANQATPGINRVRSSLTEFNYSTEDQALKDLIRWNPREYINIWVVREICNNNGCGPAGYAYLPAAHGADYDGIVVEARYVNADPANATVLAHEMGHYLGLYHTFEGGCPNSNCLTQGDRVCDTPPDNTTARTPCGEPANSCTTDADDVSANNPFRPAALGGLGDQPDMVQNYMDYSRIECYDRFTQGQKERMLNVVENIRYSLLESSACLEPCPAEPTPSFTAGALSVLVGEGVVFTNTSSNAAGYEWRADGVLFSSDANASYTFLQAGDITITLTAISALENCRSRDTSLVIEVICPVESSFLPGGAILAVGESATFSYSGGDANTFSWLIDGIEAGTGEAFTLEAAEPGFFSLCLEAGNGLCSNVSCVDVEVTGLRCETTYALALGAEGETEKGTALLPAQDGGFYLGGSVGPDALIAKFGAGDSLLWQKRFSIGQGQEEVTHLLEDGSHLAGIVTVDRAWSYCFRYNMETQSLEWIRRFDGPAPVKLNVLLGPPGQAGYIGIGRAVDPASGGTALAWVEVGKASGALIRSKRQNLAGENAEGLDAFIFGSQVFCSGAYNVAPGTFRARPAVTRFNRQGDEQWTRLYLVSPAPPAVLDARAVIPDGDGLMVAGGSPTPTLIANRAFVMKTTAEGEVVWARRFVEAAAFDAIYRVRGGYLLAELGSPFRIFRIDEEGNLLWARGLGAAGPQTAISRRGIFMRQGYLYVTGANPADGAEEIFLHKIPIDDEIGKPVCLPRAVPEAGSYVFAPIANPYAGAFSLDADESPFPNASGFATARDAQLEQADLCRIPCFEICYNGEDDDQNGTADCEDEACGCSGSCVGTFVKTLGAVGDTTEVAAIAPSSNGDLFLGGYYGEEAMIARMSPEGEVLWLRTFDFSPGPDRIHGLRQDEEGMLFGVSRGIDASLPGSADVSHAFRYDPEGGAFLWVSHTFEQAQLASIVSDPNTGSYLACGFGQGIGPSGDDQSSGLIAEMSRLNGAIQWSSVSTFSDQTDNAFTSLAVAGGAIHCASEFGFNALQPGAAIISAVPGGAGFQSSWYYPGDGFFRSTAIAADSEQLAVAFHGSPLFDASSPSEATGLMKIRPDGSLLWIRQYLLLGYNYVQAGYGLSVVSGGYLLYGLAFTATDPDPYLVLIKTNRSGDALWAMAYGGAGWGLPEPYRVQAVQIGESIYLAGSRRGNGGGEQALLLRCRADGTLEGADCSFAYPVPVVTYGLAPLTEQASGDFEEWNNALAPGLAQEGSLPAPESQFLCRPNPCLDTCFYDFIVQVDSTACAGDSMAVNLRLCNIGSTAYAGGLPLSVYLGNPTADSVAALLATRTIPDITLDSGACQTLELLLPFTTEQLFAVANDDGSQPPPFNPGTDFPLNELEECSYANNIDSFAYQGAPPLVDLGPDTTVCENSVVRLDAGPGFTAYRWQDGFPERAYTATEPGIYWVEATNSCGDTGRDSVTVRYDNVIAIDLLANATDICIGDTLQLSVPEVEGYIYAWSPAEGLSCANCTATIARPLESTTYSVVASNPNGCISVDTLRIQVEGCGRLLDTAICLGSALQIGDRLFYPGEVDSVQLSPDSVLYIRVAALDTFYSRLDTAICQEERLLYEGVELLPGQSQLFVLTAANGCDSTVEVSVQALDPISADVATTDVSCAGFQDGAIVIEPPTGGEPPYRYSLDGSVFQEENIFAGLFAGNYTVYIRDGRGCQLSREIQLEEPPPLQLALPGDETLKLGDSLRLVPDIAGAGELSYHWSPPIGLSCADCREPVAAPLESTLYRLQVTDQNGCTAVDDILVLVDQSALFYIPNAFSPNGDGRNDRLLIYPGPAVERILLFRVFSRWGELVFEEKDAAPGEQAGWDGTFNGQRMAGGVYVYYAEAGLKDGRSVE
ncbi:MAG: gliding motility-associated C-terminal domain-containing protein, partial [Phaeodactylibacter sp.]|nr:gliding motility-associated C-terminal domain-containing protein [Phaeodactylibacter sp.]